MSDTSESQGARSDPASGRSAAGDSAGASTATGGDSCSGGWGRLLRQISVWRLLSERVSEAALELTEALAAASNYCGAAQQMLSTVPNPSVAELAALHAKIHEQTLRAGQCVQRLRLASRRRAAQLAVCDLHALLQRIVTRFAAALKNQGIDFQLHCGAGELLVLADPLLVEQVLAELVCNARAALEQVPRGIREIVLKVACADERAAEVTIWNSGSPVSEQQQRTLFVPLSTSCGDRPGIGLALCRSIMEDHGGKIEFVPGAPGAMFRLTFPAAADVPLP